MELVRRLLEIGRQEKLRRVTADILPDNIAMRQICEKLGFTLTYHKEDGVLKASIDL